MQNLRKQNDIQYLSTRATAPISITDFGFNHLQTGPLRQFSLHEMQEVNDDQVRKVCTNCDCDQHRLESTRF